MKTASVREFRDRIAELLDGTEPVLVTRNGRNAGVLYPLTDPQKLPADLRRKLFLDLTADIAKQLQTKGVTEDDINRDFANHQKRRRR